MLNKFSEIIFLPKSTLMRKKNLQWSRTKLAGKTGRGRSSTSSDACLTGVTSVSSQGDMRCPPQGSGKVRSCRNCRNGTPLTNIRFHKTETSSKSSKCAPAAKLSASSTFFRQKYFFSRHSNWRFTPSRGERRRKTPRSLLRCFANNTQ